MAYYGHIAAFDSVGGVGSISPEDGGNPLAFASADLQQQDCEPEVDQRYAMRLLRSTVASGQSSCGGQETRTTASSGIPMPMSGRPNRSGWTADRRFRVGVKSPRSFDSSAA